MELRWGFYEVALCDYTLDVLATLLRQFLPDLADIVEDCACYHHELVEYCPGTPCLGTILLMEIQIDQLVIFLLVFLFILCIRHQQKVNSIEMRRLPLQIPIILARNIGRIPLLIENDAIILVIHALNVGLKQKLELLILGTIQIEEVLHEHLYHRLGVYYDGVAPPAQAEFAVVEE